MVWASFGELLVKGWGQWNTGPRGEVMALAASLRQRRRGKQKREAEAALENEVGVIRRSLPLDAVKMRAPGSGYRGLELAGARAGNGRIHRSIRAGDGPGADQGKARSGIASAGIELDGYDTTRDADAGDLDRRIPWNIRERGAYDQITDL